MSETKTLPSTVLVDRSTSYTKTTCRKYMHTWTIDNFRLHLQQQPPGISLQSLTFPFQESVDNDWQWQLECYPRGGEEPYHSNHVAIYVVPVSQGKESATVTVEVSLLGKNNQTVYSKNVLLAVIHKDYDVAWRHCLKRKVLLDQAEIFLCDDRLTIQVQITVSSNIVDERRAVQVKVPKCQLLEDYGKLLESEDFCDITFDVEGTKMKAHKIILSARSPVFSAMFKNDMLESRNGYVEITNIKPEVFYEMLRYIYTGKSPKLAEIAVQLIAAADKYSLERLKGLCEESLCVNLTIDGVADALVLSHLHSSEQLKMFIYDYLIGHVAEAIKTESWQKLSKVYPEIFMDAFSAFANENN